MEQQGKATVTFDYAWGWLLRSRYASDFLATLRIFSEGLGQRISTGLSPSRRVSEGELQVRYLPIPDRAIAEQTSWAIRPAAIAFRFRSDFLELGRGLEGIQ